MKGINNAKYKKFTTRPEAEEFVQQYASPVIKNNSPYKPNTPPVTPTHNNQQFYSQQPQASSVASVIQKSRQMSSWSSTQVQVENGSSEMSLPKKIKLDAETQDSDEEYCNLMDAMTQSQPSSSQASSQSSINVNSKESDSDLKQQLRDLKNRLEDIEESIHDVIGKKTIEIDKLKDDIAKLENQISGNHDFKLSNAIQRLKERNTERETAKPTKRTRMLDDDNDDDNYADSTQAAGSSQINFTLDTEGYCIVYTDGACTNNGRNGAKAGIGVWFGHSHPL